MTIQLLERLEQRLQKNPPDAIVFFGSIYLDEEGKMCLYPIEFFLKGAEEIAREVEEREEKTEDKQMQGVPQMHVIQTMEQYRREALGQMGDLFVSGVASVQEDMIQRIAECADDGARLGLHAAGEELGKIKGLLEEKRHRVDFEMEEVLEAMGRVQKYFKRCKERITRDMGLRYLEE